MPEIENKVDKSGIIQFNPEDLIPNGPRVGFDMKDHLYQGLVLREKEFREFIKNNDWNIYTDAFVYVHCTADAIVPTWAYMLVASELQGMAKDVVWGTKQDLEDELLIDAINNLPEEEFTDARVIVKGCSNNTIGDRVYMALTLKLKPLVKNLMFGEACSAVPVFKRK
ncbi:MAG: hypothetical protein DRI54_07865 [Bacteroidetes bacterium]|nr:MAG: hypothetical protein DRI54_07865 [Bacteroidota bacterium]